MSFLAHVRFISELTLMSSLLPRMTDMFSGLVRMSSFLIFPPRPCLVFLVLSLYRASGMTLSDSILHLLPFPV